MAGAVAGLAAGGAGEAAPGAAAGLVGAGVVAGAGFVPPLPDCCATAGPAISAVANKAAAKFLNILFSSLALARALLERARRSEGVCYDTRTERILKREYDCRSSM